MYTFLTSFTNYINVFIMNNDTNSSDSQNAQNSGIEENTPNTSQENYTDTERIGTADNTSFNLDINESNNNTNEVAYNNNPVTNTTSIPQDNTQVNNIPNDSPKLGWNWGAFMFNWIYFMSFKTSLGFVILLIIVVITVIVDFVISIALIPSGIQSLSINTGLIFLIMFSVPFIISIYFGFNGTKIVWRKTEHGTAKEFNAAQRVLNRFGFITFIISLIAVIIYIVIIIIVISAIQPFLSAMSSTPQHSIINNYKPSQYVIPQQITPPGGTTSPGGNSGFTY